MTRYLTGMVVLGWVGALSAAGPSVPVSRIAKAEFDAVVKDWDAAEARAGDAARPRFQPYAERCYRLADRYPTAPAGLHALEWVVWHLRDKPEVAAALDRLRPRARDASLEYLGANLGMRFPYGMAEPAAIVFARVKAAPDHPAAAGLTVWVCYAAGHGTTKDSARLFHEAIEYLVKHHNDRWSPFSVLSYVDLDRWPDAEWAERQLRAMFAGSKFDEVRQLASFALAKLLLRQGERARAETEKWALECRRISLGMKAKGARMYVTAADQIVRRVRHYDVGQTPPDVVGEDLDGKPMKLSEHKGKVVLVSFWGFWCGQCMRLVPHEQAVVKRLADKPFALVGVNSDPDLKDAPARLKKAGITWRSFKNELGNDKRVALDWVVASWPTVVLIDHKGVIRKRWDGTPDLKELDREIDKLVEAAEGK